MPLDAPVRALLEAKNFAHVGTIKKDGSCSVVPVWVHTDGEHIIVNTAEGRAWPTHLERDPRTTVTVMNLENPYEYAQIVGRVADRTREGANDVIDSLAKKYLGLDEYPMHKAGEHRVTIRIQPEKVFYSNPQG
ncbi:MAG: PPOX class F420-dependent oxidoreductase [Solirubrobacterales bacterium]|jgi:PPOX class probable F420-dependent enzyme|nr:PPOX class F420-dependent oxidoreductase [Solirubrobacterales bacterium]